MSSQDLAWENGCGGGQFSKLDLLKHQQWRKCEEQKQYQSTTMEIQNQNLCFPFKYTSSSAINDQIPLDFCQTMASRVEMETSELDQYIKLQNDELTRALQEQIKQQVSIIWKTTELKTMFLLRQKEEQIVHSTNQTMELQEFLRKLETENQIWRKIAQENEATIVSLNNTLDQMRETASCRFPANAAEDAESYCDMNNEIGETEEATVAGNNGGRKWPATCGGCNSRNSCILFFPCRHLCSCKACEAVLDSCPVCFTGKRASVEALIF